MGVEDYTTKALSLHNEYRARHGASPLQWSHELRKLAADYAAFLASRTDFGQDDTLRPKPNISWGQNLFELTNARSTSDVEAVENAVDNWYQDHVHFNWNHPGLSGLSFSQLVWRGTGKVGMGVARNGNSGRIVVVAFYDGPGNMRGDFTNNVLPPIKGKKSKTTQERLPKAKANWVN